MDIWPNVSARKICECRMLHRTRPDSFYSPRNITGQSTFWFGCLPTFWSKGKHNKNLDDDLMDSSICQDVSLLSGFFFLKAWDASNIFIKRSRPVQSWEAITDLWEMEGEQDCFATSSEEVGEEVQSEPWREIGKLRCADSGYQRLLLWNHVIPELTSAFES